VNVLSNALIATLRSPLNRFSSAKLEDFGVSSKLSYAIVEGSVGFAYAPQAEAPSYVPSKNEYVRNVFKVAWKGPIETSLALATLSALTQLWIDEGGEVDFKDLDLISLLGLKEGDKVIMIGYMKNVLKHLVKSGIKVVLYEDNYRFRCEAREEGVEAYPGSYVLLEQGGDAIIATGSSLLDPRSTIIFEKLDAKEKLLIGPTATVHPYFAKLVGATMVGGSYVKPENREKALRLIKAGYGYKKLVKAGLVEKWFAKAS